MIRSARRLLTLGLAAAATGLATAQPAPDGTPDAAQVLRSEGSTMLVRGASYSTPVRPDVPIRSGDRIRTGPDGSVQLKFTDGGLMSIQPGSDFRVESYAYGATRQRGFFELLQGSVRAVSGGIGKRDRDDWRLRTPTATIGIRGTEFSVDQAACAPACPPDADGLVVEVISGRVAVTNAAGSIEVPAGRTLRLRDATTVPALAEAPRPGPRGPRGAGRADAPQRGPDGADGVPVEPAASSPSAQPVEAGPASGAAVGRR